LLLAEDEGGRDVSRRLTVMLIGAAMAALFVAMAGMAWAQTDPDCPTCPSIGLAITKKGPAAGATGVPATANVRAYFNHDLRKATVTSTTFKIRRQGTTTWMGATYAVSNALEPTTANAQSESVATLNPNRALIGGLPTRWWSQGASRTPAATL
jgi:hypothetical protein